MLKKLFSSNTGRSYLIDDLVLRDLYLSTEYKENTDMSIFSTLDISYVVSAVMQ